MSTGSGGKAAVPPRYDRICDERKHSLVQESASMEPRRRRVDSHGTATEPCSASDDRQAVAPSN
jgi:hypothetical protein